MCHHHQYITSRAFTPVIVCYRSQLCGDHIVLTLNSGSDAVSKRKVTRSHGSIGFFFDTLSLIKQSEKERDNEGELNVHSPDSAPEKVRGRHNQYKASCGELECAWEILL